MCVCVCVCVCKVECEEYSGVVLYSFTDNISVCVCVCVSSCHHRALYGVECETHSGVVLHLCTTIPVCVHTCMLHVCTHVVHTYMYIHMTKICPSECN